MWPVIYVATWSTWHPLWGVSGLSPPEYSSLLITMVINDDLSP